MGWGQVAVRGTVWGPPHWRPRSDQCHDSRHGGQLGAMWIEFDGCQGGASNLHAKGA